MINISEYKYISFDVFDTLIFRSVACPENIFEIVELYYKNRYGVDLINYSRARIIAERKARANKIDKEIQFDDIFENLGYSEEMCIRLKELEIEIEIENSYPNAIMIDFLKYCKQQGKLIVVTTDMYLPRIFFEKLFVKLRIEKDVDTLIISSEEGVTKRTGELYPVLLSKLNVDAMEVLHIGDNPINDIKQAVSHGITAAERLINENHIILENSKNILDNHINTLKSLCYKEEYDRPSFYCGFEVIGPFIFDFCTWLHKEKISNNIDKLFFLAREGFLLYKCYKLLYPEEENQIEYIRINKNLLRLPLLYGDNVMQIFKDSLLVRDYYQWGQILSSLNFCDDEKSIISYSEKVGFDANRLVSRKDLYAGVYDSQLNKLIELSKGKITEQARLLHKYLTQNGFLGRKIGLVNNSFNGNAQHMLESFMKANGLEGNIFGLQFDATPKCSNLLGDRFNSYFDSINLSNLQRFTFSRTCLIFEHLLFEPIGTSLYFIENQDEVDVVCKDINLEKNNFNYINQVQNYCMLFVSNYKEYLPIPIGSYGFKYYISQIQMPTSLFARSISNLWDEDDDKNRKIADLSIPYNFSFLILKNIPSKLYWLEGYLSCKKNNKWYLYFAKFRYAFGFYRQNIQKLLQDIITLLSTKK